MFIKPFIGKEVGISIKEFMDSFHEFSDEIQIYVLAKFFGKSITEIEDSIDKSKEQVKANPSNAIFIGNALLKITVPKLEALKENLTYGNLQFRVIANKLVDTLIDHAIIYWNYINKNRKVSLTDGIIILELIISSDKIIVDGITRQRLEENKIFFEKWVNAERSKYSKKQTQASSKSQNTQIHTNNNDNKSKSIQKKSKNNYVTAIIFILIILTIYFIYNSGSNSPEQIISEYAGNQLYNGASPYSNYFGQQSYDYNSNCWLVFKNGNQTDAVVCLENTYSGRIIRNVYIRAGTRFKMENIPTGTYMVKSIHGNDWNPYKTLNNGQIVGAFDTDMHFSVSDNQDDWIKVENNGYSYTTGEITLYTVSHGNMQQRNINSKEFFK